MGGNGNEPFPSLGPFLFDCCPDTTAMRIACTMTVIALLAAATVTAAEADDPAHPAGRLQRFCAADYVRLCPDIDLHGPEIEACFRKNIDEVSSSCRAAVAAYKSTAEGRSRAARQER